ncbi:hypothetical protein HDE_04112 [Halotydeus destructor]|nr:hypothetical protein HDE_04112 [Halotydeus destructor]
MSSSRLQAFKSLICPKLPIEKSKLQHTLKDVPKSLRDEVKILREANKKLTNGCSKLIAENESLKSTLLSTAILLRDTTRSNELLTNQNLSLTGQLSEKTETIQSLEANWQTVKSSFENKMAEHREQFNVAEAKIEQFKESHRILLSKYTELKALLDEDEVIFEDDALVDISYSNISKEDQERALAELRNMLNETSVGSKVVKVMQDYMKSEYGSNWLCFIGNMRSANESIKYDFSDFIIFSIGKKDMLLIRLAKPPALESAIPKLLSDLKSELMDKSIETTALDVDDKPLIRYISNFEQFQNESVGIAKQALKMRNTAQHQANHIKDHFKLNFPDTNWLCIVSDTNIEMGFSFSWMPNCMLFTVESRHVLIVQSPLNLGATSSGCYACLD